MRTTHLKKNSEKELLQFIHATIKIYVLTVAPQRRRKTVIISLLILCAPLKKKSGHLSHCLWSDS